MVSAARGAVHAAQHTSLRSCTTNACWMASVSLVRLWGAAPVCKSRRLKAVSGHHCSGRAIMGLCRPGADLSSKAVSSGLGKRPVALLKPLRSGEKSEVVTSEAEADASPGAVAASHPVEQHEPVTDVGRRLREMVMFSDVVPSASSSGDDREASADTLSSSVATSPPAAVEGEGEEQLAAAGGETGEAESTDGQSRGVFQAPEPCDLIAHTLPVGWRSDLENAVVELDQLLEEQIFRPIPLDTDDLQEQLLHQWLVANRHELFPKHPFLLAYEWVAGNNAMRFQGDVMLWNGSTEVLAAELKITQDPDSSDHIVGSLRRRKVESQAAKTEVFALHFLAQRPQLLPLRLSLMVTGQLPSVVGVPITNHFIHEHTPHLSESARRQLQDSFMEFGSQTVVVSPAATLRSTSDSRDVSVTSGKCCAKALPSLEPEKMSDPSYDIDELDEDAVAASTSLAKLPMPTDTADICMSIVYALSKEPNHSIQVSKLANVLFFMFDKRNFVDVSNGVRLGEFLSKQYRLFISTRQNEQLTLSLPTQLSRLMSEQDLALRDILPYIRED